MPEGGVGAGKALKDLEDCEELTMKGGRWCDWVTIVASFGVGDRNTQVGHVQRAAKMENSTVGKPP